VHRLSLSSEYWSFQGHPYGGDQIYHFVGRPFFRRHLLVTNMPNLKDRSTQLDSRQIYRDLCHHSAQWVLRCKTPDLSIIVAKCVVMEARFAVEVLTLKFQILFDFIDCRLLNRPPAKTIWWSAPSISPCSHTIIRDAVVARQHEVPSTGRL